MAKGSLEEALYFMILSRDLEYHDFKNDMLLLEEVSKLSEPYITSIRKSIS